MAQPSPTLGFIARQRIGAEREPVVQPEPSPTPATPEPAPAPKPATLPSGVPNNLFSRIGLVLSNVSAGMRGQVLPTERLAQRMTQRRQLEIQEMQASLSAMKQGAEMLKAIPVEQQPEFAKRFGAQWEAIQPGFADMFESLAASRGADLGRVLDLFGEHAETVRVLSGGDVNVARQLAVDDDFLNRLEKDSDDNRMPMIGNKISAIMQKAQASIADPNTPEANQFLQMVPTDEQGRPILTVQNLREISQALTGEMEQYALTEPELETVGRRRKDLLSLGVVTPELEEEAVKRRLFPKGTVKSFEKDGRNVLGVFDEAGNLIKASDLGEKDVPAALLNSGIALRAQGATVPREVFGKATDFLNTLTTEQAKQATIKREQQVPIAEKTRLKEEEKAVIKVKTKLATDKANLAASSRLLRKVSESEEGAFGVRGAAAEAAAGWIGQINPALANDFVTWVSGGMSAQQVKTLRTELQAFVAKQIKTVTGEESGRYTEAEQALTRRVVAALEVGASRESVRSALTALTMLQELQVQADDYHIRANQFDLTGEDWQEQGKAYDDRLKSLGIESEQDRTEMMEHLYLIQQELEGIRIGQP